MAEDFVYIPNPMAKADILAKALLFYPFYLVLISFFYEKKTLPYKIKPILMILSMMANVVSDLVINFV